MTSNLTGMDLIVEKSDIHGTTEGGPLTEWVRNKEFEGGGSIEGSDSYDGADVNFIMAAKGTRSEYTSRFSPPETKLFQPPTSSMLRTRSTLSILSILTKESHFQYAFVAVFVAFNEAVLTESTLTSDQSKGSDYAFRG